MSYQENIKVTSTKGLTKGLINNYSILDSGKYFAVYQLQNYLVFQPFSRYLVGISDESITPLSTTDKSFDPEIIYNYDEAKIKLKVACSKQDSVSFIHWNVMNLYISYKLDSWLRDFTLLNCLLGAVKLTKKADLDKCEYSSYGIGSDAHAKF